MRKRIRRMGKTTRPKRKSYLAKIMSAKKKNLRKKFGIG